MIRSLVALQKSDGGSVWDDNGYLDTSDPNTYPFILPEWGNGFALDAPVDFAPFITISMALMTLFIAIWFVRVQFRPQVERLEKLKYGSVGLPGSGDNAVAELKSASEESDVVTVDGEMVETASPATSAYAVAGEKTQKRFTRDKLFTIVVSGGVAASLLMTAVLSMFSIFAYGSSTQTEAFGKWATDRYPGTLISRDQADTLLTGGEVLVYQAGMAVPVKLIQGYDGLYYLAGTAGGELQQLNFDTPNENSDTGGDTTIPDTDGNTVIPDTDGEPGDQDGVLPDAPEDTPDSNLTEQPDAPSDAP